MSQASLLTISASTPPNTKPDAKSVCCSSQRHSNAAMASVCLTQLTKNVLHVRLINFLAFFSTRFCLAYRTLQLLPPPTIDQPSSYRVYQRGDRSSDSLIPSRYRQTCHTEALQRLAAQSVAGECRVFPRTPTLLLLDENR